VLDILRSAETTQGDAVIPGLVSDAGLLDVRSVVSDIAPETSASGALTEVNAAFLLVSVIRSLPYRRPQTLDVVDTIAVV
jgi:hypothetical protein